MHLVIVTSLDGLSRNSAAGLLAECSPGTPVILHDLLDDGVVTRRIHTDGLLVERESTVLEHGCLSCTVRFDLAPTLLRLIGDGVTHAIVGLPPGTTAENAIDGLHTVAPEAFVVDSVALAVRAEDVEDQLWDHHTLFASGYTAVPEDSRTPGEFLIGEFLFADTVLTTASDLMPSNAALSTRGLQLIREVAPHAPILSLGPQPNTPDTSDTSDTSDTTDVKETTDSQRSTAYDGVLGTHDYGAAQDRSLPGAVTLSPTASQTEARAASWGAPPASRQARPTPSATAPPAGPEFFRTLQHRIDRPLHPDRFRTALGAISEGCCFVRGSVWVAGLPDTRVAVHGVGPRIVLGNGGSWSSNATHGGWCRGTQLALTGDDLDDDDIIRLLDACALTDDELLTVPIPSPITLHDTTEGAS